MFAALTYAVMQSSRTSTSMLSGEQARLAAQEIISYGDAIQKAVQTLRLRGCTMQEISFYDANQNQRQTGGSHLDHYNSLSPADGSCSVFDMNGGKVIAKRLASGFIDPSLVTDPTHLHPSSFQITWIRVQGAGSEVWDPSGTDVVLWLGRLQPEVCMAVNKILGVENRNGLPPVDTYDSGVNTFQGVPYGNGGNPLANEPETIGKRSFCVGADTSGETYTYYTLLMMQ